MSKFTNTETGTIYTRAQLSAAFMLVCPVANWKDPISAIVEYDDVRNELSREALADMIRCAVIFFCGCEPKLEWSPQKTGLYVDAVGYYAAVGA